MVCGAPFFSCCLAFAIYCVPVSLAFWKRHRLLGDAFTLSAGESLYIDHGDFAKAKSGAKRVQLALIGLSLPLTVNIKLNGTLGVDNATTTQTMLSLTPDPKSTAKRTAFTSSISVSVLRDNNNRQGDTSNCRKTHHSYDLQTRTKAAHPQLHLPVKREAPDQQHQRQLNKQTKGKRQRSRSGTDAIECVCVVEEETNNK
ncbi:hypothetical protein QVD17_07507 [Tagetes erecta]|uniref:Uncharacterized protein n=1 Tax=Tagetes erecta TaxID=13708 RepID=A0AAD8LHA9_TARER|nr:hypothetical protein QVD17_07507 [Tagetes erecta]